jgi:hypothetical protein
MAQNGSHIATAELMRLIEGIAANVEQLMAESRESRNNGGTRAAQLAQLARAASADVGAALAAG